MGEPRIPPSLAERARAAADLVRDSGQAVTVVHHIDADGVSAGAIALEALHRADIPHRSIPVRSMDAVHQRVVAEADAELLWFCDLGSTVHMEFPDTPKIVCDHHELVRDGTEDFQGHVNPLLDDLPGDGISGSGTTFLVAHALDAANADLRPLALVGAAADMQDRSGAFHGANAFLTGAAEAEGQVHAGPDLAFFGSETRPLPGFLAYTREVPVPGITNDRRGAGALLESLGVPLREGGTERTWAHLDADERRSVASALVQRRLDCGLDPDDLFRQVVRLRGEEPGTPLRELREYGTLLNSTARYDRPEAGLAVARGDRGEALQAALELRAGHRRNLVGALGALQAAGIQETPLLQWVHAEGHVRDTVLGIVCGMALDGLGLHSDRPLIGFAHTPDGRTKVSSRAPRAAQGMGLDLAEAMRTGAEAVGGQGGGHKGAAGATIPQGSEPAFLAAVEACLAAQSGRMP